jgi:hypothetical protein
VPPALAQPRAAGEAAGIGDRSVRPPKAAQAMSRARQSQNFQAQYPEMKENISFICSLSGDM